MFAYLFHLYMLNTEQKIITDTINKKINTAMVINSEAEDLLSILLVEGEVTIDVVVFELNCVIKLVILSVIITV